MSNPTNAVAKTEKNSLRGLLTGDQFKSAVQQVLPKHLPPERFIRVAIMAMTKTPLLAECDQASFFQALLTLSQLGLEPDGRRAHLIPFRNNKKQIVECQLIVDYKGLVELIINTGLVAGVHADVVCENDDFQHDRGEVKKHVINWREPRGEMYAAYALIKFKDGTEKSEVMSRDEIEGIRRRSRAANAGPWVTDYNEMAKKTVFRRCSKWVKLSPEQRDVVEVDDEHYENRRFENAVPVPAKGLFGGEKLSGGFVLPEPSRPVETADPVFDEQGEGTPAPTAQSSSSSSAAKRAAKGSSTSSSSDLDQAPAQGDLMNDRTALAKLMDENGWTWGQMQPVVSEETGPWADSIPSIQDLSDMQVKAILIDAAKLKLILG